MLRIVFMGTPEFSVPALSEIVAAGHEVEAVYTQPPRPAGRGMSEKRSPVHVFAEASGLPVLTPASLKGADVQAAFAAHAADVAVVIAYGLLLPKAILDAPRHGCLNLHGSALPRWRGAAPIQRAIMAGDAETAAMVMRMDEGLDTGPICLAESIAIGSDMTAGELHDRMALVGAGLVVKALAALERGSMDCRPQSDIDGERGCSGRYRSTDVRYAPCFSIACGGCMSCPTYRFTILTVIASPRAATACRSSRRKSTSCCGVFRASRRAIGISSSG
jgi:methionyl-tRNA formyltransferase